MHRAKIQTVIENAISVADRSYFFENYTDQAIAVIKALDAAGFEVIAKDLPKDLWTQVANEMKTGRLKPDEHAKDVFEVALRIMRGS